jgi:biotin-(acetyl-CoA carboxylase) ligase
MIIKICGVYVQFEMEDTDIYVVNYGCGSGWQMAIPLQYNWNNFIKQS